MYGAYILGMGLEIYSIRSPVVAEEEANKSRGRGGQGGRGWNANNPGCWISSEEWQSMGDEEREMIRTQCVNYAKQNIGAVSLCRNGY